MFDVPELTSMVSTHLEHHHLAQCTLVSKAWHSVVMPILWRTISYFHSPQQRFKFRELVHEDYHCHHILCKPDEEDLSPTQAYEPVLAVKPTEEGVSSGPLDPPIVTTTLMKYGHWIRNIPDMDRLVHTLTPSEGYDINKSCLVKQQHAWMEYDMVKHLLERFPNVPLQKVYINENYIHKAYTPSHGQERFLDSLIKRMLPTVRELTLYELMDIADLRRILSASAKSLTHLSLDIYIIVCNTALGVVPRVDDIPFEAGLSSLTMSFDNKDLPVEFWAEFWRDCISVTSLTMHNVIPGLVEALKRDLAEHLPISIHSASATGTRRRWRVIEMGEEATVGPSSASVLLQHCLTLEKLICWPTFESKVSVNLLASCPGLKVLQYLRPITKWFEKAESPITVQQLIDWDEDTNAYRPWACEGTLQTLDIYITGLNLHEDARAMHSKMYGRLARLTQLWVLRLEVLRVPHRIGLAMSLESGLTWLSGLKKLEVLEMWGLEHHVKHEDVEGMVENWPRLRSVRGRVNDDEGELRNYLKYRNL
ncbi:hypothetical protein BGZ92_007105 [Podila epicladia]|nr:hypothetical protein BGZ92_007105 [Podila epicladia]